MNGDVIHDYDVNVIAAINNLELITRNQNITQLRNITINEYFESIWRAVQTFCDIENLNFQFHQEHNKLVISSSHPFYVFALGIDLIQRPNYIIDSFLDYQRNNFLGNYYADKNEFVNLIEYGIRRFVEDNSPIDFNDHLNTIMEWVKENKDQDTPVNNNILIINNIVINNNFTYTSAFQNKTTTETKGESEIEFEINLDEKIFNNFYSEFKKKFKEDQHDQLKYILSNTLSNKEISKNYPYKKFERKLNFDGYSNTLVELLKRMRYNDKINYKSNYDITDWLVINFNYKLSAKEETYKGLVRNNVYKILSEKERVSKRICTDLFPYLMPKDRNNK
jgi:hypothetical protein